jgi:hypothetical protein
VSTQTKFIPPIDKIGRVKKKKVEEIKKILIAKEREMKNKIDRKEILLSLIDDIPEGYREESLKTLIDFAEFLKMKTEKNVMPFMLCRSFMQDWLSPEEDKAWKYLENETKKKNEAQNIFEPH